MLGWVVANVILASSANACLKLALTQDATPLCLLAFFLNASSFVVLYFLLRANAMAVNQVYVSSGVIVASCACGAVLFHEQFGRLKLVSIALAFASVITMWYANSSSSYAEVDKPLPPSPPPQ